MKKFLFIALAAFMTATVSAQVVTSTSFKKGKSGTVWYIKAGANIANVSVDDGDGPDAIFGYNVGIAGVGVWYQRLNFNITYQNGLVKQNESKEKNWMISLGYAF